MKKMIKKWVIVKFNITDGRSGYWDGSHFGYFWEREWLFGSEDAAERYIVENGGSFMIGASVIGIWDYAV